MTSKFVITSSCWKAIATISLMIRLTSNEMQGSESVNLAWTPVICKVFTQFLKANNKKVMVLPIRSSVKVEMGMEVAALGHANNPLAPSYAVQLVCTPHRT
eukprot:2282612-Amphidinium_carterae.1